MRYERLKTISMKDAGYKLSLTIAGEGRDWAVLDNGKRYSYAKMSYVYWTGKGLGISLYQQSDADMLYSFVVMNNRRIIIETFKGYSKYKMFL